MIVVILGPQGSGKGTQARLIAEKLGFFYFGMGDLVRRLADTDPALSRELAKGDLMPDSEGFEYVKRYLENNNSFDNIVFDGFPRSVVQYELLKNWLKEKGSSIDFAVLISITENESIKRLTNRRKDPKTGEIYNLVTNPPPDNVDRSSLVQREDDNPEAIKKRLELYKKVTLPLIEQFREDGILIEIDGEQPIDVIFDNISSKLSK
ncbi:hypothetical protein A3D84_02695 [Candidatus Woesebacteria bacterium RIFCSPHIGHO2_02_FULL_42_20]|uniref:Adenylate kinase n=1 Tax=Candidatus Woesebacteria bacterium RIFCSPHIGHO2_12_FULL_41_24 TaxID=1802510 RepID=A0A1F8AQ94_9BACT|nr:MAG: hypothetical protein A2W15_02890 [Candidatus Woesebacteria bacterium RBG_16_41_13]OGM29254.1 MAG: hypothetical protein A2873_03240 [Candidatus Woesebacteria bacterium RIFCSPHIGHO2_01_FULL_42_80]OGM34752.1 MAG: hypothetical protein A3D84_02695 [Candidatus Woesebacteria bacterium RIFCSPHIGHO2_02_FULL_42_20]OGM53659.1 MAG: hypothetical protein A3E44_02145 [Candidatus Woesebacteria bacterium RIFCSPHIGHO2_12_FULL_41_24]OGM67051.1 MAG: hypothetical protein A2969_05890 [Candidatus Woesebacteri